MDHGEGEPIDAGEMEGVNDKLSLTLIRTREEAELRASSVDFCEPERGPVSEPVAKAKETDEGPELPDTEGGALLRPPVVLGFWLAALGATDICHVAGLGEAGETCVGPALPLEVVGGMGALPRWPRWLEFTDRWVGNGAAACRTRHQTPTGRRETKRSDVRHKQTKTEVGGAKGSGDPWTPPLSKDLFKEAEHLRHVQLYVF